MSDKILNEAKALQEVLVKDRRFLHQTPERGLRLTSRTGRPLCEI